MNIVVAYLRLIRWPNLLIIALTQFLVRYFILIPYYGSFGLEPNLNLYYFSLLVLSTMMIAAAGYVINDYFDVRSDAINKPKRLIIDVFIKRRVAMALHFVLNILAVSIGIYIGWKIGNYKLGVIHFMSAGMLWFYSTSYKRQFLTGNIIVALLSALVILIVGFYERQIYTDFLQNPFLVLLSRSLMTTLLYYGLFAFIISLIREIIKDMEDVEGDRQLRSRTMPIVLGIKVTKYITIGLLIIFLAVLAKTEISLYIHHQWMFFYYGLVTVVLPSIYLTIRVFLARSSRDFHLSSSLTKGIMLLGILSMLLFRFGSLPIL